MRVWLLGGFRVSVGSRKVGEDRWRLRKAASLVKLLALSPGHRVHRERVMDLLWPDLGRRAAAIFNVDSSPTMTDVTAKASGGNYNIGVDNNNSTPLVSGSTLEASGVNNHALLSFNGSTVRVDNSRLIATGTTIYNGSGTTTRVGASQLEGGPVSGPVTCAGVYDENYAFFASTCP